MKAQGAGDAVHDDERYRILRELGSRAIPTFAAETRTPTRTHDGVPMLYVVERYMRGASMSNEEAAKLVREAKLVAALQHTNLTRLREVAVRARDIVVVSEFVDGETLASLWRRWPKPPLEVVLRVLLDVLTGLTALHAPRGASKVIHGELSTTNVIVGLDGITRIVRWARVRVTGARLVPPECGYVAPELLNDTGADQRADVYAVGAMLWEALMGAPLFPDADAETIVEQVRGGRVPRATAPSNATWAAPLCDVAARALSAERYANASVMAMELRQIGAARIATTGRVAAFMKTAAGDVIAARRKTLGATTDTPSPPKSVASPQPPGAFFSLTSRTPTLKPPALPSRTPTLKPSMLVAPPPRDPQPTPPPLDDDEELVFESVPPSMPELSSADLQSEPPPPIEAKRAVTARMNDIHELEPEPEPEPEPATMRRPTTGPAPALGLFGTLRPPDYVPAPQLDDPYDGGSRVSAAPQARVLAQAANTPPISRTLPPMRPQLPTMPSIAKTTARRRVVFAGLGAIVTITGIAVGWKLTRGQVDALPASTESASSTTTTARPTPTPTPDKTAATSPSGEAPTSPPEGMTAAASAAPSATASASAPTATATPTPATSTTFPTPTVAATARPRPTATTTAAPPPIAPPPRATAHPPAPPAPPAPKPPPNFDPTRI